MADFANTPSPWGGEQPWGNWPPWEGSSPWGGSPWGREQPWGGSPWGTCPPPWGTCPPWNWGPSMDPRWMMWEQFSMIREM
ncbi:MAG: hypothetical protein WAP33_06820, partial [bacterium]